MRKLNGLCAMMSKTSRCLYAKISMTMTDIHDRGRCRARCDLSNAPRPPHLRARRHILIAGGQGPWGLSTLARPPLGPPACRGEHAGLKAPFPLYLFFFSYLSS